MNERIKQLVEQATESIPDDCPSIEHSLAIFNKKFAELIVRDCAGVYAAIDNGNEQEGTRNYLKALKRRYRLQ